MRFNRYEFYLQDSWSRDRTSPSTSACATPSTRVSRTSATVDQLRAVPVQRSQAPTFSPGGGTLVAAPAARPTASSSRARTRPTAAPSTRPTRAPSCPASASRGHGRQGRDGAARGWGIYYDQPLIGIFLQNAFVNPPFVASTQLLNPQLSNPAAGTSPTTRALTSLIASSDPFETPRTQQWNVGVMRQL